MNVLFVCVANSGRSVMGEHVLRRIAGDRCDDACPVVPGKRYLAWQLPDPKDEPLERVREIRDEIDGRLRELVAELDREQEAA